MTKLNLGCGWRNFGEDWIHIDGGDYSHLDSHDITSLPYEDGSVDLIYASHVIEYFDREDVENLLSEWVRCLKVGGVLRIAVPDFDSMARLYVINDMPLETFLGPLYGKMSMGDETIYHKTVYDEKRLKELFASVGMRNISLYDWRDTEHSDFDDHSQAYIPHMDKDNGTLISLNLEAVK
tara:strand:+ start:13220 stop:13759 length:540 start_codon:yes stop_codon:yes gene_type:complete